MRHQNISPNPYYLYENQQKFNFTTSHFKNNFEVILGLELTCDM
jgi:hypothetical protein